MPPPKSKKKKSKFSKSTAKENKSSKSTAKEVSILRPKAVRDLNEQAEELSKEWEASAQREVLVEQIRERISSQRSISINNALCLGLGSLEKSRVQGLPGWTRGTTKMKNSASRDQNPLLLSQEDMKRFKPVANGEKYNKSLYQLLVFETTINCLRRLPPSQFTFCISVNILIMYPANTVR